MYDGVTARLFTHTIRLLIIQSSSLIFLTGHVRQQELRGLFKLLKILFCVIQFHLGGSCLGRDLLRQHLCSSKITTVPFGRQHKQVQTFWPDLKAAAVFQSSRVSLSAISKTFCFLIGRLRFHESLRYIANPVALKPAPKWCLTNHSLVSITRHRQP